ncbi:hypothetical protein [Polaribacter sp. AHE13PA]|uniref:hypothetical protein n=1 Tax=Polaribacter sp. AHE13PA TaxID=2745562 RepID=UPI001C4F544E|nr:hypothetical protein [Polaribacter sp. AHE13PA]QXP65739.1 hypothetical protein H0I28_11070 [Polaribacter sp. AHE13PA]
MNKIKQDIKELFDNVRLDIEKQLDKNFDIEITIKHLSDYIPKEVIYNSEMLLETLLSYLMIDAQKAIEKLDVKTKNKFYDAKLNEKIIELAYSLKEDKNLINSVVEFRKDRRKRNAYIASGATFIAGAIGVNAIAPISILSLVVSGLVVLIISAFTFKLIYDKATIKTRVNIREDAKSYLKKTEKEVDLWLNEVTIAFNKELQSFMNENSTLNQISK